MSRSYAKIQEHSTETLSIERNRSRIAFAASERKPCKDSLRHRPLRPDKANLCGGEIPDTGMVTGSEGLDEFNGFWPGSNQDEYYDS